jgi:glycosyltransferase involved in cell wall biosynthesis
MHPRVSYVIPCYNYGRFVNEAVDSLLGQSFEAIEVIVIDDASTDDTPRRLERYAGDARVHLIRHPENRGHIATYNEGIAMSRGEFVGLMAADDYCPRSDAVERQVAMFDADPRIGVVYTACTMVDERGSEQVLQKPWPADYVRAGLDEFRQLILGNYVPASGTLVRKTAHDELGDYDPRLPHAGDWDLWLRVATRYSIGYIAQPMFAYRMHNSNMSHSGVPPRQANAEVLLTVEKAFAALPATAPEDIRALRDPMLRHALYVGTASDRALGRTRRSWAGLVDVARRSPVELARVDFYTAVAKLSFQTVLGFDRYVRMSQLRRPRAAAAA